MVGLGSPLVGTAQPVFGDNGDNEQGDGPIYEAPALAGKAIKNRDISED
jgi:hypothetical protein